MHSIYFSNPLVRDLANQGYSIRLFLTLSVALGYFAGKSIVYTLRTFGVSLPVSVNELATERFIGSITFQRKLSHESCWRLYVTLKMGHESESQNILCLNLAVEN